MSKAKKVRGQPRQSMKFRVRSRDLPGYRAMTFDYSQTGVQLETDAPLGEGVELPLEFEFDREDLRNFSCGAKVVWCRPAAGGRHFRVGLTFLPADDEQRTALARTATVLQARSETDLKVLLDEAKLLDPERAETFARVRLQSKPSAPAGQAAIKRVLPMLGVYIPLTVAIEGYLWDRKTQLLTVSFVDAQSEHHLYFPACRLLTDHGCSTGQMVAGLYCTPHSDTIKRLPKPAPAVGWKHYRFLLADKQPLLELVSAPCQSVPVLATS